MWKILRANKVYIAVFLLAGIFVGWTGVVMLKSPLKITQEIVINEGRGVSAIADALKEERIIGSRFVFIVYAIVTGNEKKLQAGRYVFRPGVTVPAIVRAMAEGFAESDDIVVTIPEGFNVFDIDKRLASVGLIQEGEFAKKYQNDEGQFFPDTYRLRNHQPPTTDHQQMMTELTEKMSDNFKNKTGEMLGNLNIESQNNIVIIASLIEKEARKEEDMRLVAGVIENRLARKMHLQIDATVVYGACLKLSGLSPDSLRNSKLETLNPKQSQNSNVQNYKHCDVSQVPVGAEIKIDEPYNTYTRAGLPPGPIANPGITAIQAVLDPIKSDYLYYLSPRGGGDLIFSKTAAEHATNRRKYLGIVQLTI